MKKWHFSLFTLISIFVTLIFINSALAQSADWFDNSINPTITLRKTTASLPKRTYYKAPCAETSYKFVGISGFGERTSGEETECSHTSSYGLYTTHGIRLAGTDTVYAFRDKNSAPISIYPVPGGFDAVKFSSAGGVGWHFNLNIVKDVVKNIEPQYKPLTGQFTYYKLKKDPAIQRYQDGSSVSIIPESIGYGGGRYISANTGSNQVLIDLQNNTTRRFGFNTYPSDSTKPTANTTVSNDGSLVLVMDPIRGIYRIYNLEDCSPNNTTGTEDCVYRDISQYLKQNIPDFRDVVIANFISKNKIEAYARIPKPEGGYRADQYVISVGEADNFNMQYLALGDSYASGEGVYGYKALTDVSDNKCHVSLSSYPYLIKAKLEYENAESVACSGAKIKDIKNVYNTDKYEFMEPQAKGKVGDEFDQEIYAGFLPGYRYQTNFVENKNPAAITVSIGGNDINFGKKLQKCILTPTSCYQGADDRKRIFLEIKNQFAGLAETYKALKNNNPLAKVYVIGYPYILKPDGNCAVNVRLSNEEINLAQDIETDLNKIIETAAKKAGVQYVDASLAMAGRRLCEDESWKLAFNGVTAGNDKLMVIGNETYHPNKIGHQSYETTILQQTSNLTNPMPEPDETVTVEGIESVLVPGGAVESTLPTPILSDGISEDSMKYGDSLDQIISVNNQFLKPGSQFSVEIHSTPRVIGTATASDMQSISVNAVIPEDLEAGPHSLHIIGTNINNQPVDFYKDILVIKNDQDYDGDGILNEQDSCNFIEPSNVDSDKDGKDDACDGEIAEPPAPPVDPIPTPPVTPPKHHTTIKKLVSLVQKVVNLIHKIFFIKLPFSFFR